MAAHRWAAVMPVVASALAVGAWAPLAHRNGQPPLELLSGLVLLLSFALAGGLVARFRPTHPVGWLLSAAALSHAMVLSASSWVESAAGRPADVPGWRAALVIEFLVWPAAFHLVPLALLLFPSGRPPSRRWHWLLWLNGAAVALFALSRLAPYDLVDASDGLPVVENPIGVGSLGAFEGLLAPWGLLLVATWAGALASVVVRWRRARGVDRVQLRWLGLGCSAMGAALAITAAADAAGVRELGDVVVLLLLPALPLAVTLALLRHDLFDVGAVARTAVAEVAAASAVAVVYVGVAAGVTTWTTSSPRTAQAAATVLALLLLTPLRHLVREEMESRLRGISRRPWEAVSRVHADVAAASTESLLDALAESIAAATRASGVAVDLVEADGYVEAADHGTCTGSFVSRIVEHRGQPLGRLRIYRRSRGAPVDPGEERVLAELAVHTGPLLAALRANEQLQEAREQLVLGREEERRRIRRDLHDGAGPALAGLSLRLSALLQGLRPGDPRADDVAELARDVRAVATDLRRLVEGLRPPLLDEVGLPEALQALGSGLSGDGLTVEVLGEAGSTSAAVEVAAYRIAAEAVTNSVRHSGATRCTVRLTRAADTLVVEVADDGCGIASDAVPGTGSDSMRRRCEELGGSFCVSSAAGGGTVVRAQLPTQSSLVTA